MATFVHNLNSATRDNRPRRVDCRRQIVKCSRHDEDAAVILERNLFLVILIRL
jgi:hypothetical protein